jgi:hypothetical protein
VNVLRYAAYVFVLAAATLALLLTPSESSAQRGRQRTPSARQGRLVILSQQQGAQVFVDEVNVGTLPIEPQFLAPGDHTLRVTQPGFTDFTDVVTITAGAEVSAEVELIAISAVLHVETTPSGAQVFIDARFVGTTPGDFDLGDGPHSIRVRLAGYHEIIREATGVPGERTPLVLPLEQLPADEDPTRVRAPPTHWYEKPWTWIAIGGGALAVAVGIALIIVLTADQPSQLEEYCPQSSDCLLLPTSF